MKVLFIIILSFLLNSGTPFKTQLENYLNKNLASYESYKYEILQLPDSYKKIELLKPNEFNISGNLVYVPVKMEKDNGRVIKSIVTVKIKIFRNVYLYARQVNRNEKLVPADFRLSKEDITSIKGTPVYSLDNIDLYRSKVMVPAGGFLVKESVEKIPVVNVGDEMNASYAAGNILVTFKAFARQEGVVGEVITVISADKKLYRGKVIDSKNLKIVE